MDNVFPWEPDMPLAVCNYQGEVDATTLSYYRLTILAAKAALLQPC